MKPYIRFLKRISPFRFKMVNDYEIHDPSYKPEAVFVSTSSSMHYWFVIVFNDIGPSVFEVKCKSAGSEGYIIRIGVLASEENEQYALEQLAIAL